MKNIRYYEPKKNMKNRGKDKFIKRQMILKFTGSVAMRSVEILVDQFTNREILARNINIFVGKYRDILRKEISLFLEGNIETVYGRKYGQARHDVI